MNNNQSFDDLLDLWVTRKINLEELALQGGSTLSHAREQADLHMVAVRTIQNHAIAQQVSAVHLRYAGGRRTATIHTPIEPEIKVVPINRSKWFMRAAASVALVAGLYFAQETLYPDPNKLYNAYFQEYHVNTERSLPMQPTSNNLVDLFKAGKFVEVTKSYAGLSSVSNREIFLTGYSNLKVGNYGEATQLFSAIISKNNGFAEKLYMDEAEYYLALTYLKTGATDEAYDLMKKIKRDKSHTFNEKISAWTLFRMKWFN